LEINEVCIADEYDRPIGDYNEQLASLISFTPFESSIYNKEEVNELIEDVKSSVDVVNSRLNTVEGNLGLVGPTAVPYNPGTFIGNLYLNTALSIDEVKSILNTVVPNKYDYGYVLVTADHTIYISKNVNSRLEIRDNSTGVQLFDEFSGWNTELVNNKGCYEINGDSKASPYDDGRDTSKTGIYNEQLVSLISLTPFDSLVYNKDEINNLLGAVNNRVAEVEKIQVTENSVTDGKGHTFNKYDDTALAARVKELEDNPYVLPEAVVQDANYTTRMAAVEEGVADVKNKVNAGVESANGYTDAEIAKVVDGTYVAKKAEQDAAGNVIVDTYATKTELSGVEDKVEAIEAKKVVEYYEAEDNTPNIVDNPCFVFYCGSASDLI
jgi:hypothetical protein